MSYKELQRVAKSEGVKANQKQKKLLAFPSSPLQAVVLLDEPTSGLDSDAAFSVMQSVQALAHAAHGPAIVATVHQVSTCGRRAGRSGGLTTKKAGPATLRSVRRRTGPQPRKRRLLGAAPSASVSDGAVRVGHSELTD